MLSVSITDLFLDCITQATFCCTKCGHKENADVNAAKNIRGRALSLAGDKIAPSIPNLPVILLIIGGRMSIDIYLH